MPDEEDIKQEEAMEIARNVVKQEFGENAFDDGREWDRVSIYFWDYYNGEHEWRFCFYSKAKNSKQETIPFYEARLNAKTGEVNKVYSHSDIIKNNPDR